MRPFLKDTSWDPRRVQQAGATSSPRQAEGESSSTKDSLALIPPEDRERVRSALQEAEGVRAQVEAEALEDLTDLLDVPTDRLPQTREAVRYLAGTHPSFGKSRPAVPESQQIPGDNITAPILERAYRTVEQGGRLALGFGADELMDADEDGLVKTYGPARTPLEAASGTMPEGPTQRPDEALEQKIQTQKRDIWYMMFQAVISFALRLIGDIFEKIGDVVKRTLSFKIVRWTVKVGKFVAKPIYWLADRFYQWADEMEKEAMGMDPTENISNEFYDESQDGENPSMDTGKYNYDPNEGARYDGEEEDGDETPYDTGAEEEQLGAMDRSMPPLDTPETAGSSGMVFLMSSIKVLQQVQSAANRSGADELAGALRRYDRARQHRGHLQSLGRIATSWGATPADAEEGTLSEPAAPPAQEDPTYFECNQP